MNFPDVLNLVKNRIPGMPQINREMVYEFGLSIDYVSPLECCVSDGLGGDRIVIVRLQI